MILRWSALTLGIAEVPVVLVTALQPERLGLPAAFILVVGGLHALGQFVMAALPWQRWMAERDLSNVVRLHVLSNLGALFASMFVSEGLHLDLLWIVALGIVYSSIVLPMREHLIATIGALAALWVFAATKGGDAALTIPLVVLPTLGLLGGLGAKVVNSARTAEARGRHRAERAEDALRAVVGSVGESVTGDRQRILDAVTRAAAGINNDLAGVYWLTPDGKHTTYAATHGVPDDLREGLFPVTDGLMGMVVKRGATVVVTDYLTHPETLDEYVALGLRSAIGSPIRSHGDVVGVLVGGRLTDGDYTEEEVAAFEMLARNAGAALEVSEQVAADRRLLTRLRELDRLKQDFVTTVSHELRTPLTVITGLAETLSTHDGEISDDQRRHFLARIHANSLSLNGIVSSLLDVASLDKGFMTAALEPFDVAEMVRSAVARLGPMLGDGVVTIDVPTCAVAVGDSDLLERVVDNLLVNAERHTPPGTPVHVSVVEAGDDWVVSVEDEGPGIDPDDRQRILSRFERGGDPNSRPRGGLGLGLALCAEILDLHHVDLELESRPGRTTFSFSLPRSSPLVPQSGGVQWSAGAR